MILSVRESGRFRAVSAAVALAALVVFPVAGAAGQVFPTVRAQRDTVTPQAPIPVTTPIVPPQQEAQPLGESTPVVVRPSLLDAPISRTEYLLGPGDRLDISVFGELNRLFSVLVGPEGSVVIPGVGITRVLGLNLDQAEARVRQAAARYLRNVDVRLTLAQVRTFKVFVVGNVAEPGVRTATAATRVSEVVTSPTASGYRPRNVILRRSGGDSVLVDLIRFETTGDVSANPTLREGDAVVVPTADERVTVSGRVRYPGAYEFRPGETLADFLNIVNGGAGFPANAADTVRLVRYLTPDARTELSLSRAEATGARGRALALQPFDAVYVSMISNYKEQPAAAISGQVQRPGAYPIRPDTTTVRELVTMAGGFTPLASLVDATLRRQPPQRVRDELSTIPPELLSDDDRRIVQVRNAADSSMVVIDFTRLFTPGTPAYHQTLRPGDLVTVPVRRAEVSVQGAVRNPGMIAYNAGSDVRQYLAAAGGLSSRANVRRAVVLRARTGARLTLREAGAIEPGDVLIIPFREERDTASLVQMVTGVVTAITGAVVAAVAVLR
ncbi:MAG TPA: SLBB domain-containing protein [Longimicrobium sp.]|nr:SLBB domain-containing protein [Longimicrobium sp.]